MRILITTDLYIPTINGVVTSVLNLEKELKEQGHEVKVLTVSDEFKAKTDGIHYYMKSIPSGIYPEVRIPFANVDTYVNELIAWHPDIVHSQCEFFSFYYAKKIAKATGAALVHTYHTLYEQYTEYIPLGKVIERNVLETWIRRRLRNVECIIAPTRKVERTLRGYGIWGDINVIPTGIRLDKFKEQVSEEKLVACRAALGISAEKKILLSLGRLGFEKNTAELLQGFARLLEKRSDLVFLIVGDGPARQKLEEKTRELGIEEQVKFAGMVKPEEVGMYYQMGDVFVCASTSETQGLTYIEALANGLPLVCRKDECLNGVLQAGENGYAYETMEEFAGYIEAVLQVQKEMRIQKSRASAYPFSTEVFGKNVENVYRKIQRRGVFEEDESITICEKQRYGVKKRSWTSHGYARRIS